MVDVQGISKSYGGKTVLKQVNIQLNAGEQAAIIGRNGCGKSTLLNIMAGLMKPDSGSVSYFGHDIYKEKKAAGKYCGYLPQGDCLIEELSVEDNISLWCGKKGKPDRDILEFFKLNELLKEPVKNLSGGMKRRVSIACTAVGWPSVLLLDEPTNGLDIYHKQDMREFLQKFRKINGIIVLVTHDEKEIEESSRCFELADGVLKERKK